MPFFPVHTTIGAVFDGAVISAMLYGITCSQVVFYYRTYRQDRLTLKSLVGIAWVLETLQGCIISHMLWYYLIRRGIGEPMTWFLCADWSLTSQIVPTELSCMLVEGFLIQRMWRLSERKRFTLIVLIPLTISWVHVIAYVIKMFYYPCYGGDAHTKYFLTMAAATRALTDGLIAATLCYMLYNRRVGVSERTNSLLKSLLKWTLTTGVLMCAFTLLFLILYAAMPTNMIYIGAYLVNGKVYTNTLLATLNSRQALRSHAERAIELEHITTSE